MQRSLTPYVVTALITLAGLVWLYLAGRDLICPCGTVKLWDGWPAPGESSQHLLDWYTLSHVIHGILFYALLWLIAWWLPVGWRLAVATAIEVGWEIVENSATVIEHYRTNTVSVDYNGDSVINSLADVAAMWLGFWLASRLPVWLSVVTIILFEIAALMAVRDGLTLNILGFVWPMEAIVEWQAGAYAPSPAP
jgi:Protein of unknown function (DUF2585)